MMFVRRTTCWRRRLVTVSACCLLLVLLAPVATAAEDPPPVTLPPPPVTVQDVVNELLPLIRQLEPVTKQIGPALAQLNPLFAGAGDFSTELKATTEQLVPFVAQVAPLAAQVGDLLGPVWQNVHGQVTPETQALLELLAPYLNQVDLATAFQVIGPVAPTAVKAIPIANRFYDAIDVVGPLRDPMTCPLVRALPQQKVLDIVVPFLCYNTIVSSDPGSSGFTSTPSPEQLPPPAGDPEPLPSATVTTPDPGPASPSTATDLAAPPPALPAPTGPAGVSASVAEGPLAAPTLASAPNLEVQRLERRMRLMAALLLGLGLLLWSFFRPSVADGLGGLGAFRKPRATPPPDLD